MAYLYRHIRLDKNIPFYIGIGVAKDFERAYSKRDRNKIWKGIISRTEYAVEILFDNISWKDAIEKEKEFIKIYGRIEKGGILANMTDGGDGTCGIIVSEKTRKLQSELSKSRTITKETREKMAAKLRGRKLPEWQKEVLKKAHIGIKPWGIMKPILAFDINGFFINEYESSMEAGRKLNVSNKNICKVLQGERNHTQKFIFRYKGENLDNILIEVKKHISKGIEKRELRVLNINNNINYKSIKEAAKTENIPYWMLKRRLSNNGEYMNLKYA